MEHKPCRDRSPWGVDAKKAGCDRFALPRLAAPRQRVPCRGDERCVGYEAVREAMRAGARALPVRRFAGGLAAAELAATGLPRNMR